MQAVIEQACQLFGRVGSRQVGTANVSNEQRVASQCCPRFLRLFLIGHHQANTFQSMSRSFKHADAKFACLQFKAVVDSDVSEGCSGLSAKIYFGACTGSKFFVSRNKVGMQMGLKNV